MLDAFEARLIEVLGDGLAAVPALTTIARPRDGLAEPTGATVQLRVRLLDGRPQLEVGDDERARIGQPGDWRRRITLRLEGEIELAFRIGVAQPNERELQRQRLIHAVDRTLVWLADEAVRSGHVFRSQDDRGFELDGFRLLAIETPRERDEHGREARELTIRCRYAGRFWPVGEEQAGVAITGLPIRQVVLPAGLPDGLRAKAGSDLDIELNIAVDAMRLGSASSPSPAIMARLLGASPGSLLDPPEPGAVGWVRIVAAPEQPDRFVLHYRTPAAVSGRAEVRIALAFARDDGARVELGTLRVEVIE